MLVNGSEKLGNMMMTKPKATKAKSATAKPKSALRTKAAAKPAQAAKTGARQSYTPTVKPVTPAVVVAEAATMPPAEPPAAPVKPAALEGLPPISDAIPATPKLAQPTTPEVQGPEMKKRELVDAVVKRSGVKKKDAKQVVDAMLAILGETLAEQREMVLQPMGRLKVTRVKPTNGGQVLICKLRQNAGGEKADKEALAEDDD